MYKQQNSTIYDLIKQCVFITYLSRFSWLGESDGKQEQK